MPPYSSYLGAFSVFATAALGESRSSWTLGQGIEVNWQSGPQQLSIVQANKTLLATVPGQSFLSASAGKDQWAGANGNFNYTNVDLNRCQGQNVTGITHSLRGDSISGEDVSIQGYLQHCGDQSIGYSISFWVPKALPDRVAFNISVEPGHKRISPMKSCAQASFASMKNQTIPIFTREQGVGRGDQPITALENSQSWFSGGNEFTTYTAIPQYISSAARPNAVTVRYDALTVGGHVMQADTMLNAITMLTDYVGKMPTLPEWVDHGAILGIRGGQEKVERIVKEGLKQDCPVAAVWLQDWSGTHSQEAPYGNMQISRLWWNWESDSKLYPTWTEFVQDLREEYGVKTLAYINPFVANVSSKADGYRRNLFLEATKGGYMAQNSTTNGTAIISSGKGIQAGILDLTNQKTRSWFADVLRKQVWNANISGVMWDFGEYTPITPDTKLANISSDAYFYHNQYPRDWAIFQRSVAKEMPLFDEMVTFHRSARSALTAT
ncbi:putative alpha-glucosidase [Aspergillus nomiae NRRL 13137]|uniref:Putative alpha-glucosidase n=1 Tax=Aspergillus nomiae NRRL (strain ATCC 15546 / NRRL 13137 / CBS 260.88 / M93) TaxID=1509407 RepID=A0A0L1J544_ASPN3|nr:putative alpha-glucosidase [Aspergillus nomiae NRRL 13137]KNG86533.1 putative alpha-glucosidase [Aspergillus nomiae NRRL 13137]